MAISFKVDEKFLNPSAAALRKFGFVTGSILAVLFGLVLPWLFNYGLPLWPWIVGGVLIAWAIIHPQSLRTIHNSWLRIGAVLGYVNSRIILGALFYLMITPVGIVMRILGKKLIKGVNRGSQSYREQPSPNNNKQMENPY